MFVNLKPLERASDSRRRGHRPAARQAGGRARARRCILQAVQDLRIGGRASNAQYQFTLQGESVKDLNDWAPRVYSRLRTLPQLADVNSDQQVRGLEASLAIDRGTASRLGITTQMIDDTLYDAFGQRQVSTMYTQLNQYHVVMEVEPRFWQNPDVLKYIYVRSAHGRAGAAQRVHPLRPGDCRRSQSTTRDSFLPSRSRSISRPAWRWATRSRRSSDAEREIGVPASIRGSFQGTAQAFQASLATEPFLIAAALLDRLHRAGHAV